MVCVPLFLALLICRAQLRRVHACKVRAPQAGIPLVAREIADNNVRAKNSESPWIPWPAAFGIALGCACSPWHGRPIATSSDHGKCYYLKRMIRRHTHYNAIHILFRGRIEAANGEIVVCRHSSQFKLTEIREANTQD